MRSNDRVLARHQLDKRLNTLRDLSSLEPPVRGWIKAIRESLGMTMNQLGQRMNVSQPRIADIEKSENGGGITLDTLRRAAQAMDCRLVYAIVPRKPLGKMVENRARQIAKTRIKTTAHNMALESQTVLDEDELAQFEQLLRKIIENAGSDIWDGGE